MEFVNKIDRETAVSKAKGLAKYFQLTVELKLFGYVVWKWIFPPKS